MAQIAPPKFGEEALALGFIRARDIRKGLQIQTYRKARGLPAPLLGEVLLELGVMTQQQVEDTFESLCSKSKKAALAPTRKSWWAWLRGA
jgi:hypothetical protein